MSLHSPHEGNAILFDDCPRCLEHAQDPFNSLDDRHLVALLLKVDSYKPESYIGTYAERLAMLNIDTVMQRAHKLAMLVGMVPFEAMLQWRGTIPMHQGA